MTTAYTFLYVGILLAVGVLAAGMAGIHARLDGIEARLGRLEDAVEGPPGPLFGGYDDDDRD